MSSVRVQAARRATLEPGAGARPHQHETYREAFIAQSFSSEGPKAMLAEGVSTTWS
jgi:hypothetical protein